uniref:Secreted protein n=1 Tax=Globisporangium ultimum (strain ATCC 200006 / CBS 805.95 / DAOM BR144) TaxID=431595 RepID=K3X5S9_GLOUD
MRSQKRDRRNANPLLLPLVRVVAEVAPVLVRRVNGVRVHQRTLGLIITIHLRQISATASVRWHGKAWAQPVTS